MYHRAMAHRAWTTLRFVRSAATCLVLALPTVPLAGYAAAEEAGASPADDPSTAADETSDAEQELHWGDGHHYEGGLKAGQMHGRGTHTTPEGEVYTGDFVNGQRHGQGTLRFANGDVYAGDFRNGGITGRGRLTWSNGDVYQGDFVEGVRQGRGVLERQSGGTYVGDFSGDQRHGMGRYRWRDGTLYKGHFAFGKLHRSGVKTSPSGERSFETWNDGQLTAAVPVETVERCSLTLDGKPWMFNDDTCINGLAHGEGLAVALDGTAYVLDGRFILGNMVRGEIQSVELGESP
ncbi:MAG: hypothetical protein OXG44_15345 [Gammaproteobacteria bacterium]|nr:hypothetical protein [Gammaproteobacteria bacterium]